MKFIDEITLTLAAGDGGDGVVRWRREPNKPKGGPSGGNGGRGGDIFFRAVRDIEALSRYSGETHFVAEHGKPGGNNSRTGEDGGSLILEVPVGTHIVESETGKEYDLTKEGEEVLVLKGGNGGYGNEHFKSSKNVTPTECTIGKDGMAGTFALELRLIADAGFVGLPNEGKSSLLNALTNAKAKVANYEFTTLDPNLADLYGYILADIPGIIEGAADGKGLGHKFLRHIKRTKTLIFCISASRARLAEIQKGLEKELKTYDSELLDKKKLIVITKSDEVSEIELKERISEVEKMGIPIVATSIYDDESIKRLSDTLVQFLKEDD